ncbi:MAG: beta-galactosidase [Thermoproteota archaeon]
MSIVSFDERSLRIRDKPLYVLSGEIHYFRIPKELWEDRLLKFRRAFLNAVSIYFAWNWHERYEGIFKFAGWHDVDEFLRLCEKHGLYVIARPGPYICSEWDFGGLPNWLIGRDVLLRSLDEKFMVYTLRYYYHIVPTIRKHLATKGGSIILFQIENEYFWGNVPYMLKLHDAARERGIDVPIAHNVNRFLRGTQVIDSIDIYPDPWNLKGPENQAAGLIEEQPDKPRMIMEFEGGWFASMGGKLPTDRGNIPAEWTDVLLKTMIFKGFSLINFYMFHGGTNFGYWTGKNIATTYDYQAPIREWGELGERYWAIRLIGALLECFNELFASSTVDGDLVTCDDPDIQVGSRTHGRGNFILLFNKSLERKEARINAKNLGERKVNIDGRASLILPCNLMLPNGWILEFSTCQVFYSYDLNGRTILILYGEPGSEHESTLIRPSNGNRETMRFKIGDDDSFILIEDSLSNLLLVALNRKHAARTWFAEHLEKRITLISGFELLREHSSEGKTLYINLDFKEGDERQVRMILPWRPKDIKVKGISLDFSYDEKNWILSFMLPEVNFKRESIKLDVWRQMSESLEEVKQENGWIRVEMLQPPEALGFVENGHMWYLKKFRIDRLEDEMVLFIPRVNDYATIFLNGRFIGFVKQNGRFELNRGILQEGENEIMMLVESTGHRNDGLIPLANGLNEPVFLGKEMAVQLSGPLFKAIGFEQLLKPGLPASLDYSKLLNEPEEIIKTSVLSEGWMELSACEPGYGEGLLLFKYVVKIPKMDKKACLVMPSSHQGWGRIIILVNMKHAKTVYMDEDGIGLDVTGLLKQGEENTFIFIAEGLPDAKNWKDPSIRFYDCRLDGEWMLKPGLLGENKGWFKPGFEDSSWPEDRIEGMARRGTVVWLRKWFEYGPENDAVSPLMLKINGLGSKCKIYLNGELIGRYVRLGPQTDFYMPEPFLRGKNLLAIAVENYADFSEAPGVQILPYYVARRIGIKLDF